MDRPPLCFWDTCVFLSHLKGESRSEGIQTGIRQTVQAFDSEKIVLATSAVTLTEIVQVKNPTVYPRFMEMLNRENFVVYECTVAVSALAGRIRDKYFHPNGNFGPDGVPLGIMLGSCDALQIATAAILGARSMITLDRNDKPPKGILAPLSVPLVEIDSYRLEIAEPQATETDQIGFDM